MIDITVSPSLIINALFHIFILFMFLYIFFFMFISKTEEDVVNSQVNDLINKNIPEILKNIDEQDVDKKINWDFVKTKAQEMIDKSNDEETKRIKNNNGDLMVLGSIIIMSFLLLIIFVYIYYTFVAKEYIDIKKILIENLMVFIFIGLFEYLFFTQTAINYVPVFPNLIGNTILEKIKNNIMQIS